MSSIAEAASAVASGRLVVMPTDTVYGVAAPLDRDAIQAVFAAKGRPPDKPLPVLGHSVAALRSVATFDARAEALAERFWPGPLTLVLPRAPAFAVDLGGGQGGSVAVRVPKDDRALELLAKTGPLAVTSANASAEPPARTVDEARAALGDKVAVFVDGGRLDGSPSTIVSLVGNVAVIREGDISFAEIQRVTS